MAAGVLAEFGRPAQGLSLLVALALPLLSTATTDAAEPSGTTAEPGARSINGAERRVVVGILGGLETREQVALAALLGPELELSNLALSLEMTDEPIPEFISREGGSPRALLVAVVDARERDGIELYIVDPARGRALLRRLPGGLEANRALLEAIASIVVAAAQALAEGLEVASLPVEDVMKENPEQKPAVAAKPAPVETQPSSDTALATSERDESTPHASEPHDANASVGAGLTAASFDSEAAFDWGARVSVSARLSRFGLELACVWYLPVERQTPRGAFNLQRLGVDALAGYWFGSERLGIRPELGVSVEFLRRTSTEPEPGVEARSANASSYRTGAVLGAHLRHRVSDRMSLALSGAGAFFPSQLRIVAEGAEREELVTPFQWVAIARAGAEIDVW